MRAAEYYLAQAKLYAEMADSMKRPHYKDRRLKAARDWNNLAKRVETGGAATQHRR